MEKLYEYKRFGFSLTVYPIRISIVDKSGGAKGFAAPKETDILIRNITDIRITGLTRTLEITTNDGKSRKIPIYGKPAEKVREMVLSNS